jgi:GT2 family glycosyltransferase
MAMNPALSIIIVHWNTPELLNNCLNSIFEHEIKLDLEVIIVDNHSKRGITNLKNNFSGKVIELEKNIGFGPACNLCVEQSKGDYLLFLGPDVLITRNDTIYNTLEKLKNIPDAGAFSCQLLNHDGTPQRHSFNFPRADKIIGEWWYDVTNRIPYIYRQRVIQSKPELQKVDMVIAHWLMVSKAAFVKAGGFPKEAFMFGDDIELNKTLMDAGYKNYVYNGEQAVHIGRQSTVPVYQEKLHYIVQDSVCRFAFRHYGVLGGCLTIFVFILGAVYNLLMTPIYAKKKPKKYILENWRIIWHYLAYQWRPGYIAKMADTAKD